MDAPDLFYGDWIECMIEDYKHVLITGDVINEASLRDMMISVAGFSVEEIEMLRETTPHTAFEYQVYVAPIDKKKRVRQETHEEPVEFEKYVPKNFEASKFTKTTITHPDGFMTVNIAKSKQTHYAKPDRKTTLCGKKWVSIAEDPSNPMYTVCEKCKKLT